MSEKSVKLQDTIIRLDVLKNTLVQLNKVAEKINAKDLSIDEELAFTVKGAQQMYSEKHTILPYVFKITDATLKAANNQDISAEDFLRILNDFRVDLFDKKIIPTIHSMIEARKTDTDVPIAFWPFLNLFCILFTETDLDNVENLEEIEEQARNFSGYLASLSDFLQQSIDS